MGTPSTESNLGAFFGREKDRQPERHLDGLANEAGQDYF